MSKGENQTLFTAFTLGNRQLKNRIVMAPMTRGRARNGGLVPTNLHVEYYRQRASAGLILTEATWSRRAAARSHGRHDLCGGRSARSHGTPQGQGRPPLEAGPDGRDVDHEPRP
jgi:2,4-dienoyl-CoA reductase-like NADH-dependent reductase (Old Yellow Enzyme family)